MKKGVAGITAAGHIRKRSDHKITVISAETDYFSSRTALMDDIQRYLANEPVLASPPSTVYRAKPPFGVSSPNIEQEKNHGSATAFCHSFGARHNPDLRSWLRPHRARRLRCR